MPPGTVTGKTQVVGVWGHPVGHSRSPQMHNAALAALALDWVYVPFDVDPARIASAVEGVRALNLVGVNITVPLKELVGPHLDSLSDTARQVGAVNTIVNRSGVLHGDSTDGPGFLRALAAAGQSSAGRRVMLLGAGGSARAVAFALAAAGNEVVVSTRTENKAQSLVDAVNADFSGAAWVSGWGADVAGIDLIVNATPLGMTPYVEEMPAVASSVLTARPFVYDLIYNPSETRLLREARAAGCETANGARMLVEQGVLSLALWTERAPETLPADLMLNVIEAILA